MLIVQSELHNEYIRIRNASTDDNAPVLIFVSAQCDSVCAAHILTSLFRSDHIPYKVTPVSGYDDLFAASEKITVNQVEYRSIVLINCGATVDLQKFFAPKENSMIFVIDSRRPYHLDNVKESMSQIRILDNSTILPEYPSDDDIISDDDENVSNEEGSVERHRRRSPEEIERREEARAKITEYYHSSHFETSASTVCFEIAEQLEKNDHEMLWCGVVGVTDQYMHQRIVEDKFKTEIDRYMHIVLFDTEETNHQHSHDSHIRVSDNGTISFAHREFAFELFRHWSLFESMFHSRKVATKLFTWTENGKKKIHMILAKLGIPLKESHMSYSFMDMECKERLRTQLLRYSSEYGLEDKDLFCPSFTRKFGGEMVLSASDMVFAICGLLEQTEQTENPIWHNAFWTAHDALKTCNIVSTKCGIALSIDLQKDIVRCGYSLLAKDCVSSVGHFRVCTWNSPGQYSRFCHPLALSKLAFFLIDAYENKMRASRKRSRGRRAAQQFVKKPFVMSILVEARQTYLVIGIPREDTIKHVFKNQFSRAFTEAALSTNARVRQDGFEASFIEVRKEDYIAFMQNLNQQLDYM